ncbi:glycosyltransferase 87 family protein [Luteipulveratus flavus]|uniref:Glycosyltransferase 87 family protein n=1 Tax=Luteipulveratus flavus TaxID=3031728 RepID=A0ABT6CAV9_9MICO|nr:glycosyltransferase 87 family protein [Luteipulveratus sp. YIM 133296]MDF8266030.1 glycosyltransferase 87 family protein [Luteipulveratus sp. YIM 133296]
MRDGRRLTRSQWAVALAITVVGALPLARAYLIAQQPKSWQIDVQVYRDAGVSLLQGRPVYEWLTQAPQYLPFTYPPFAAILAIPLALLPFGVVGWLWSVLQLLADLLIVRYAGRALLARSGRRAGWLLGLLTVAVLYLLPVSDGFRFGQVNAFLVLGCLLDLMRPRLRWLDRVPQGVLVGVATAIKLTPGVFIVHFLVSRQWRAAAVSAGTAAGVTLGSFVLLPQASFAFWGGALQDPTRLGANDGTSNQSIRGILMRLGLDGTPLSAVWLLLAAATAVLGFGLAKRAHDRGNEVAAAALVGMMAVLLSPVSWIHHFHWLVLALFALLGSDPLRHPRRIAAAVGLYVVLLLHLPWWGQWHLVSANEPFPAASSGDPFWTLLNNSYGLAALLSLLVLAWREARRRRGRQRPRPPVRQPESDALSTPRS